MQLPKSPEWIVKNVLCLLFFKRQYCLTVINNTINFLFPFFLILVFPVYWFSMILLNIFHSLKKTIVDKTQPRNNKKNPPSIFSTVKGLRGINSATSSVWKLDRYLSPSRCRIPHFHIPMLNQSIFNNTSNMCVNQFGKRTAPNYTHYYVPVKKTAT